MNNRCTHPVWCILLIAIIMLWTLSPAGAAEKTIKYGIATPLSGPAAPWGIPHVRATEMVFDEVNTQGGIEIGGQKYKIEIVSYDHKYIIAEGVATVWRSSLESFSNAASPILGRHCCAC